MLLFNHRLVLFLLDLPTKQCRLQQVSRVPPIRGSACPSRRALVKVVTVLGYRRQLVRRVQLKCGGTRTETRFRLSEKRVNSFKSAGASVQSTTGSQGVRARV